MEITRVHRELIDTEESADKLRDLSIQSGMLTLQQNCRELVKKGITTVEEIFRVTFVN
jgi:type IV pilus assembly protein PilB